MKTKIILIAGLAIVIGAIIAVMFNVNWPTASAPLPVVTSNQALSGTPLEVSSAPKISAPKVTASTPKQPTNPMKSNVVVKAPIQKDTSHADQSLIINGYSVQDPTARLALSFVGADSDADEYWVGAINDPNLPSAERKDLIEDLNEDGLSNPQHPGPQDIPLIVNRIRLIEELAPNAMDQVNADAFAEAYKDLAGMLNGQPPQ